MSIKVLGTPNLWVVYFWNGYEGDFEICCVCANERIARIESRRRNLNYLCDSDKEALTADGDVDYAKTDGDSQYYVITSVPLLI